MGIADIPVRVVGPGSQPVDEDGQALSFIDMPGDMATYRPPSMPEPEQVTALEGAREAMAWLRRALASYQHGGESLLADLGALDDESRELVNQILGEGEVSITSDGRFPVRTQEAVLAGVWRSVYLAENGSVLADILEVADVPHLVRRMDERRRVIDVSPESLPQDVMNALPILVELAAKTAEFERTGQRHEINLTLLPLSDADVAFLDERLGRGPVDTLSRAYGKCQVISTAVKNVWWVRYYNSMGTLILNTLEVIDVPAVLCAAPEDLRDSAERLVDILTPYWPEVA